ncbi:FAD:protein FMN transferase [Eubacteriales bacterium mix99]
MTKKRLGSGIRLLLVIALILTGTTSCRKNTEPVQDNLFAMDTYITFSVSGGDHPGDALNAARERIREIERRMSVTVEDSDVSRINRNAGKQPVPVHSDTLFVIQKALQYAKRSSGAFDITTLPVSSLWNIGKENQRIPAREEIKEKLSLVDYKKVKLDKEKKTVFLETEGMGLDLGGIAKGYAGDEAVRILKKNGVTHALVNLGGNIAVVNGKEDGTPWRIGIQNPRMEEDKKKRKHVAVVETKGKAVVTSGDYERYMTEVYKKTGKRYHHIFDPQTGYPANNGVISATVLTKNGIGADALTTSLFILGVKDGLKLADQMGVPAMLITQDKKLYFSKGLKGKVSGIHPDYKAAD